MSIQQLTESMPPVDNTWQDDPLMTVAQAAAYCQVSKTTINKLRREKKIPCVRVTSDARFRRSDLNRYFDKNLSWGWYKHGGYD